MKKHPNKMNTKNSNTLIFIFLGLLFSTALLKGQNHKEMLVKIKKAANDSSKVMNTVSMLSDVYGPRLLGTPNYYNSILWIEKEVHSWGIYNTHKPSFDNDHRGWVVEDFSVHMVSPSLTSLQVYPMAFTSSTKGDEMGETILIKRFEEIYSLKGEIRNKIILLEGYYRPNRSIYEPFSKTLDQSTLNRAIANPDPNDIVIGYHSRRSILDVFEFRAKNKESRAKFFEFCKSEGVIAVIEPSNSPYGIIHADGNTSVPSYHKGEDITPIPTFCMSNEHFGRLLRLTNLGYQPKLKINLQTKFYNDSKYNINFIADIPGTDPNLKDELVIIGAHLDSWHAGTGAVDNASNCAVVMEAMRLIKMTNLKPKRTIRMILWGGEEQIFAGSSHYVNTKVSNLRTGEEEDQKQRISAYLNLDNGSGKIRGVYLMGNEKVKSYFAQYLEPFKESQVLTLQYANQTDHEVFDFVNVPGFQFIQDPLDYIRFIHHTNMDVFEYVSEEDVIYNSELLAYFTYQIAQEKYLLPRNEFSFQTPSRKGNTTFELDGYTDAKKVFLVGDFNQWNMISIPLYKTDKGWETKIDLPKGRYFYKFIVDGYWTSDPRTPDDELVKDGKGHGGLTIKYVN